MALWPPSCPGPQKQPKDRESAERNGLVGPARLPQLSLRQCSMKVSAWLLDTLSHALQAVLSSNGVMPFKATSDPRAISHRPRQSKQQQHQVSECQHRCTTKLCISRYSSWLLPCITKLENHFHLFCYLHLSFCCSDLATLTQQPSSCPAAADTEIHVPLHLSNVIDCLR